MTRWRSDSRPTGRICAASRTGCSARSATPTMRFEVWLRLSRADASGVDNLGGWLTTVVARVCLDMLRCRTSRREESLDARVTEPIAPDQARIDPEQEALLADSVGLALLVVLDALTPAERL